MRKTALFLLTLSLVAFGCDVGALCAATQAADGSCCCPMAMAMGMGDGGSMAAQDGQPPCMEETDQAPMPTDSRATFDGTAQSACAPPAAALPLPMACAAELNVFVESDPAAGQGIALYLLGCSLLN